MSRRARAIVGVVAAGVVAALAAAYLTGFIIVGDPYSGVWNVEGQWNATGFNGGSLIKQTDSGYVFTYVQGTKEMGWHPLQRHGRSLEGEYGDAQRVIFEYQPWTGHLVWTWHDHGLLRVPRLPLKKATDSTSVPPQTD